MASLGLRDLLFPQVRGRAQQAPRKEECDVSVRQVRASTRSRASKGHRRSGAGGVERSRDDERGAHQAVTRGGSRNWKQPYDAVDSEILSVLGGLGGPGLLPTPGTEGAGGSSSDDGGAGSISQLAKRLADLLSDAPSPGEVLADTPAPAESLSDALGPRDLPQESRRGNAAVPQPPAPQLRNWILGGTLQPVGGPRPRPCKQLRRVLQGTPWERRCWGRPLCSGLPREQRSSLLTWRAGRQQVREGCLECAPAETSFRRRSST